MAENYSEKDELNQSTSVEDIIGNYPRLNNDRINFSKVSGALELCNQGGRSMTIVAIRKKSSSISIVLKSILFTGKV